MNHKAISNTVIFVVLLAIPLVAEFITATPDNIPGTGIHVLLYSPFDFAYLLLAGLLFIGINNYYAFRNKTSFLRSLGLGFILLTVWFLVSFLAVGQLHIGLGGKL